MDNKLLTSTHTLICLPGTESVEHQYVADNFCGKVTDKIDNYTGRVYFMGDLSDVKPEVLSRENTFVINELSCGFPSEVKFVPLGMVPINIHGVGVFFRRVFTGDQFDKLKQSHQFQVITESIKPNNAFRKGIYMTEVEASENGDLLFHLLRCSSNLGGPTEGFNDIDRHIVKTSNELADMFFEHKANLNHVLAQIYDNFVESGKQKKAKIRAHSDKTKDMPRNGLLAFCTFYDRELTPNTDHPFDVKSQNTSVLTRLKFKLKKSVVETHPELAEEFDITLYPGSVFIMSLEMNRYYTHETKTSSLPIDKIPTRLGYVVRCSKTKALSRNGQNYILDHDDKLIEMKKTTPDNLDKIRHLYFVENTTSDIVDYEADGIIDCSMNNGDYMTPVVGTNKSDLLTV